MHRSNRSYAGSALLLSAGRRLMGVLAAITLMWVLSAWALGWL